MPARKTVSKANDAPSRTSIARDSLIEKLHRHGWLDGKSATDAIKQTTDRALLVATKAYQGFHGLEVDGVAGPITERSLTAHRFCALPDVMPLSLELNKWPDPNIRWHLDTATCAHLPISAEVVGQALEWAWAQWAAVCGVRPTRVMEQPRAHVRVTFGDIDGPGKVLAWSELANDDMMAKTQKFDGSESWAYAANPARFAIDLGRVACHEIGHVLGLPHLANGNLLQPMYDTNIRTPQAGDIAEVVARYGRPVAIAPVPPPAPSPSPDGRFVLTLQGKGNIEQVTATGFRIDRVA